MIGLHRLRGRITALVLSEAWRRRAALWGGAVAVALVAILFAKASDAAFHLFQRITSLSPWWALLLTPGIFALLAWPVAFFAAYPVNRYLLQKGKGHALTHKYHGGGSPDVAGVRRFIPSLSTPTLTAAITAFMLGGLVVAVADRLGAPDTAPHSQTAPSAHATP